MRRRLPALGLALACVVPLLGGVYRGAALLLEGHWAFTFAEGRVDRVPLFVHVVSCAVFYVLGALQVLPGFRRRHPRWHRRAGAVALVAGLLAATSAIWMSVLHPGISGPLLRYGRLLVGPLWLLFLGLGAAAIVRRDFRSHGAWMVRAFAVGMPAGTLVFISAPFWIAMGELPQLLEEAIQTCAWVVHLGAAELLIQRGRRRELTPSPSAPRRAPARGPFPRCLLRA